MNKSILKRIAYELKEKLDGNAKAFIFVVCQKYLQVHRIFDRDQWLKNYLQFDGNVSENGLKFLNEYDELIGDILNLKDDIFIDQVKEGVSLLLEDFYHLKNHNPTT